MMKFMRLATLPIRRITLYTVGIIVIVMYTALHLETLRQVKAWAKYYGDNLILAEYILRRTLRFVRFVQFCDLEYPEYWDEYLES